MGNSDCPFCSPPAEGLFYQGDRTYGLWDQFPVSDGHALLIPKRQVATWCEATREEQRELTAAIETAQARIEERLERESEGQLNEAIVDYFIQSTKLEPPPSMVDNMIDNAIEQAKSNNGKSFDVVINNISLIPEAINVDNG